MSYFGFSEDFEDLMQNKKSKSKSVTKKFKVGMGTVSEVEKIFIESLSEEHKNVFYPVFIKSIAGYYLTIHTDEYEWVGWVKFMLAKRQEQITKLKLSYKLNPESKPVNSLANLAAISEEECFGNVLIDFPKSHIRLKIYTDPDYPA
jgi:hypothetical protein